MAEKDVSIIEKGQTFNPFVSRTPMITLDKLMGSEIICHGRILWNYGLLVMVMRIILLLWTQVSLKINVLSGEKLMLYYAIFSNNLFLTKTLYNIRVYKTCYAFWNKV